MSENLELHEGRWRPAVPLPFYGLLHVRCGECGKRFLHLSRHPLRPLKYERHFRRAHMPGPAQ